MPKSKCPQNAGISPRYRDSRISEGLDGGGRSQPRTGLPRKSSQIADKFAANYFFELFIRQKQANPLNGNGYEVLDANSLLVISREFLA